VYYIGLEAMFVDYEQMEGYKQIDPNDFETGRISQNTGPAFKGWTPMTPVHRHNKKR